MSDWSRLYEACNTATGAEIKDIYDAHLVVEELDDKCRQLTKENEKLRNDQNINIFNEIFKLISDLSIKHNIKKENIDLYIQDDELVVIQYFGNDDFGEVERIKKNSETKLPIKNE